MGLAVRVPSDADQSRSAPCPPWSRDRVDVRAPRAWARSADRPIAAILLAGLTAIDDRCYKLRPVSVETPS